MAEDENDPATNADPAAQYGRSTFLASPSELLKVSEEEAAMMPVSFGDTPEISGHGSTSTGSLLAGFAEIGSGSKFFFRNVDLSPP